MNMRTLINPAVLAAGLLLGMTTAVQAHSGNISVILHDHGNVYDIGYRYGDHGYNDYGHHRRHHNHGHHYGHHKKQHWHHDRHDGHRGRGAHGSRHGDSRRDMRRH